MAELVVSAVTEALLVALAKHCKDCCLAAIRYPEETARIRLRLTYFLCHVPEWSKRITTRNDTDHDDDNTQQQYSHIGQRLNDSLSDLSLCVEALGTSSDNRSTWRKKIRKFLEGKALLDRLLEAENDFNRALDDLNIDNINFLASEIPAIHEQFSKLQDNIHAKLDNMDTRMISVMLSLFKGFDQLPAGNVSKPNETMNDVIEATLEMFHKKDAVEDSSTDDTYSSAETLSSFDATTDDMIAIDRNVVVFKESFHTRLGQGTFAEVFKGLYDNDDVAVKAVDIYRHIDRPAEMSEELYNAECNQVRDEAKLMRQCSVHSNIVDVIGYCPPLNIGSKPLIVMEQMHDSLSRILHQRKDLLLPFRTRLLLMKDVASAVEFLHLQGIVHQDIKTSNILVDESITTAKLTDFGVAECKGLKTTWTQRHDTALATVLKDSKKRAAGTLAYQAPELVLRQVTIASRSAEIYSLGVTIWECLSRTIPHHGKENEIYSLAKNERKMMMKFPVTNIIGDNINSIPNELDAFCLLEKVSFICTSKDPLFRPTATNVLNYLTVKQIPGWYLSQFPVDIDAAYDITNGADAGGENDSNNNTLVDSKKSSLIMPKNINLNVATSTVLPLVSAPAPIEHANDGIGNTRICKVVIGLIVTIVVLVISVVVYFVAIRSKGMLNIMFCSFFHC
jgi:serine/threonine protein kinase